MLIPSLVRRSTVAAAAIALFAASPLRADVKLPAVLADHMVLQQEMPVPIWGMADPGEKVTVTFGSQTQTATADGAGKWKVALKALKASDQPAKLTITGKNTISLNDILVGEVWVCAGQSNMEMGIKNVKNASEEVAAAQHPQLRLFTVPKRTAAQLQSDILPKGQEAKWLECTPTNIVVGEWNGFSAVGYFFGRDLHQALHVPVGLIHTSWGGTPAEAWTPTSYLQKESDLQPIVERTEKAPENYQKQLARWQAAADKAKADGKAPPRKPTDPAQDPNLAAVLYNGMVAPIVPYAIRGATWYQGESNASRAYQYRKLLPTMIQSWRDAWGEPNMSFLIVSLANYQDVSKEPGDSDWAELREAQAMTAAMPHNGQALAIDLADADNPRDIHPKNKQDVGRRLTLVALAKTYGQNIAYSGPEYESAKIEGNKVRISFRHAEGMKTKADSVKGFQIAGEDHKWHWADAKIDGKSIIVSSPEVEKPAAVRYDWSNNPEGNLINKAGLPAAPFRTDTWAGVTEKRR
jgi:sialate O-acetylesterase